MDCKDAHDAAERMRREQSDCLCTRQPRRRNARFSCPTAHLRSMVVDGRCASQDGSICDASFNHHFDDGHLRAYVSRSKTPTPLRICLICFRLRQNQVTRQEQQIWKPAPNDQALRICKRAGRESLQSDATTCDGNASDTHKKAKRPNRYRLQVWAKHCRVDATTDESAPRRTRTFNPLIKSQMLCQLS